LAPSPGVIAPPTGLLTIPAVLEQRAIDSPDADAVVSPDRRLSFSELRIEARRAAAALVHRGVVPGERVAIWLPNSWQWVVACFAVHYAGAVLAPLNTRYTAPEADHVLRRVCATVLIAAADFAGSDRVANLLRNKPPALRHVVRLDVGTDSGWDEFVSVPEWVPSEVDTRAAGVRPDDVADIFFTSGTTGRSKGVPCTHRQSLSATEAVWQATGGLTAADRYLCVNPFFHTFGYRFGIVACLQAGAAIIPEAVFDPEKALATIAEERVTVLPGPPVIHQMLLDHPARRSHDLGSWRLAVTGSTTLPVSLIERMQRELDVVVVTGYGLTEVSGYGTTCRPGDDPATVATTCGRPIPGLQLRIHAPDETGAGEVLLRGPYLMPGYLDDPGATAKAMDGDGWLHTGDVGKVDGSGNLRITGRIKEIYICGGFNVSPTEVEQVLAAMDEVAEVAVTGVPDRLCGEVGRAFIVARPGAQCDEGAVIAYARTRLADFKVPRSVVFVAELPRNASGKVVKSDLVGHSDGGEGCVFPPVAMTPLGVGGPPMGMVENWVADVWQSLLGIERPGREDPFTHLGGDSVSAVEFCRMLKSRYGVAYSVDALAAHPTIAAIAGELKPGGGDVRAPVVTLRTDGDGPVLLMVPGLGGHAWIYSAISAALESSCDVLALSLIDIAGRGSRGFRSAVRRAALTALRERSLAGRQIALAGFSFGALIAADLSCWLPRRSIPVDQLFLLDPEPWDSRMSYQLRVRRRLSANTLVARLRKKPIAQPSLSSAARKLEQDIAALSRTMMSAYLDGSVRLPHSPTSCLMSTDIISRRSSMGALFGTPVPRVDTTVFDALHNDLIIGKEGARRTAHWLDQRL